MSPSHGPLDLLNAYRSPITGESLQIDDDGLRELNGPLFPFLKETPDGIRIPNFLQVAQLLEGGQASLRMYDTPVATEYQRDFLSYLFRTFELDDETFRKSLVAKLRLLPGQRVLITGCGLGDEIAVVLDGLQGRGEVFAADLVPQMVVESYCNLARSRPASIRSVGFSVCDACHLPFQNGWFDATFHFGGINFFDDVSGAIAEMARVTKPGGRVAFGDEGVAPWLVGTDYGRMVVANNQSWSASAPLVQLPFSATEVNATWVLGNCFYFIDFVQRPEGPHINPDVPHTGRRGGSMRTRFAGQLEGVSIETKERVLRDAAMHGMTVFAWLEEALKEHLQKSVLQDGDTET